MHDWKPVTSKRFAVIFRMADLFWLGAAQGSARRKECQTRQSQQAHDARA
jgi:hypothetical protein